MRKTHENDLEELVERWGSLLVACVRCFSRIPKYMEKAGQQVFLIRHADQADYADHEDYKKAVEFRKGFTPKDDADHAWAVTFAKESYKELDETFRYLDDKADAIIKYMGGGTAVLTLASLVTINYTSAFFPFLLLPSLAFALQAIYHATQARCPTKRPNSPPVWEAIRYTNAYEKKAEATFVGLWNQCCEGLAVVNEDKAKKVDKASRHYYRAVLFLLFPLIAWPLLVIYQTPLSPKPIRVEIVNDGTDVRNPHDLHATPR